uniref:Uncharacterized protein n=1 Tax=Rhizophora mucronata TaxID=61149 RepID=A0A2P2PQB7_RHIMU
MCPLKKLSPHFKHWNQTLKSTIKSMEAPMPQNYKLDPPRPFFFKNFFSR